MGLTQLGFDWAFCENEQEVQEVIMMMFPVELAWSFFPARKSTSLGELPESFPPSLTYSLLFWDN